MAKSKGEKETKIDEEWGEGPEEAHLFVFTVLALPGDLLKFLPSVAGCRPTSEKAQIFGKKDLDNKVVLSGRVASLLKSSRTLV